MRRFGWSGSVTLLAALFVLVMTQPGAGPPDRASLGGAASPDALRLRPWDRILTTGRFVPAMGGAGILDRETGLVWEQAPDTATLPWVSAPFACFGRSAGGRKGWRLPAVEEMLSLVDPSATNPALPANQPFAGVVPDVYWTATTIAGIGNEAYGVSFLDGGLIDQAKTAQSRYWCVRGGAGYDGN